MEQGARRHEVVLNGATERIRRRNREGDGARRRTLAMIWDAAWKAGGGDTDHGRLDPNILRGHYEDLNFYVR
jgi:hypothetical protein